MARFRAPRRGMLAYAVLVTSAVAAAPTVLRAQAAVVAEPVAGLVDVPDARITQVTRDGGRVVAALGPTYYGIVLDTHTGAVVTDAAVLSPEGSHTARIADGGDVYVRDLASGEQRLAYRGPMGTCCPVLSDKAAVAATSYNFKLTGILPAGVMAGAAGQVVFIVRGSLPFQPGTFTWAAGPLGISADGRYVIYGSYTSTEHTGTGPAVVDDTQVMLADLTTGQTHSVPLRHPELEPAPVPDPWVYVSNFAISGDGMWVGLTGRTRAGLHPRAALVAHATGHTVIVAPQLGDTYFMGASDTGRVALVGTLATAFSGERLHVVDRTFGLVTEVTYQSLAPQADYRLESAHLSGDGRTIVGTLVRQTPTDAPNRRTFIARLDRDGDGLHDAWEATFGLDPTTAADAALDPDGDGRTTAQEYTAGTHPHGTPARYFAEGANGSFFATSLALFNPTDADVTANVRFQGADGATASKPVAIPANGPAYLETDDANLPFTEFSIVVESPVPLVAERRMTWDRTRRYGSHRSAGVAAPSKTWHFAEGATIAGFQAFFLLQNPNAQPATVTVHYLLATGATEMRTHIVPLQSRLTVWTNQEGAPLDAAEFATMLTSDQPIVAERAMYRDAPGEVFAAGSVAAGVATPATSWFFAEGATGDYFDTYVLIANPGDTPATAQATYVRAFDPADTSTATPIVRAYTIPARARLTIWVTHEDPALASTQVSTRLVADQPIVAERAMWWPGPTAATWRESHAEVGATEAGLHWAVADLPIASAPDVEDAFLLLAATQPTLATARVALACADGTRVTRDVSLSVHRTTLWIRHVFPETVGRRCAATVESLPTRITLSPEAPLVRVPLVVESAVYGNAFAAGGVTLATRLPDPPE